jgi:hypothetical protein
MLMRKGALLRARQKQTRTAKSAPGGRAAAQDLALVTGASF